MQRDPNRISPTIIAGLVNLPRFILQTYLPRNGCLLAGRIAKNRLQLKELFKPRFAPFSAITGLFVASETTSKIHSRAIQMDVA